MTSATDGRLAKYEAEQRKRTDIDQRTHTQLLEEEGDLRAQLQAAPPEERRAIREQLRATGDAIYELRHGTRSELGDFAERLSMDEEARLHAAHRALNKRADELAAPDQRSPFTRAVLAARSNDELRDLAGRAEALVRLDQATDKYAHLGGRATGSGLPNYQLEAGGARARLAAYARGESLSRDREIE